MEFWEYERHKHDLFISPFVTEECKKGDPNAAKRRLELIENIPSLSLSKDVDELAERYFKLLKIPERAKTDCFHIAVCVIEKMDYLMSWNMTHLASRYDQEVLEFNIINGLWRTKMCTPDVIIDLEKERLEI